MVMKLFPADSLLLFGLLDHETTQSASSPRSAPRSVRVVEDHELRMFQKEFVASARAMHPPDSGEPRLRQKKR